MTRPPSGFPTNPHHYARPGRLPVLLLATVFLSILPGCRRSAQDQGPPEAPAGSDSKLSGPATQPDIEAIKAAHRAAVAENLRRLAEAVKAYQDWQDGLSALPQTTQPDRAGGEGRAVFSQLAAGLALGLVVVRGRAEDPDQIRLAGLVKNVSDGAITVNTETLRSPILALWVYNSTGRRVPSRPPPTPVRPEDRPGFDRVVPPGQSLRFEYAIDFIDGSVLKPGRYEVEFSHFVQVGGQQVKLAAPRVQIELLAPGDGATTQGEANSAPATPGAPASE